VTQKNDFACSRNYANGCICLLSSLFKRLVAPLGRLGTFIILPYAPRDFPYAKPTYSYISRYLRRFTLANSKLFKPSMSSSSVCRFDTAVASQVTRDGFHQIALSWRLRDSDENRSTIGTFDFDPENRPIQSLPVQVVFSTWPGKR